MHQAFTLNVGRDGLATLVFDLPGKRANVIGVEVMAELEALIADLGARRDIACLLLLSGKPSIFIAGADVDLIEQVDDPQLAETFTRRGQAVYGAWERLPFPTVAAVRGTCMGGGTELCLASTFIVISDRADLRIGLPEVRLGILPAWGGCTRLPRRVGIEAALDMILPGKAVDGKRALKMGLADALLPDAQFLALARDFALAHRGKARREAERPDLKELLLERNPLGRKVLFDQARRRTLAETQGNYPAPLRAIEVIRIGIEHGRSAGLEAEARAAAELSTSTVCKNLLYLFKLTEEAKKATLAPGGKARDVREVAVLGAGVMGGAIAQVIAEQAAIPVRLKDIRSEALATGMAHAAERFQKQVGRRRLTEVEARRRMALLRPTLVYHGLGACDLMIEAVVESVEVKQAVFAEAAAELPADAVLASNTSSLSVEAIGAKTPNPERVVGMHFFNPVHRMPLVEVVVAPQTSPDAVETVAAFARKLGKTPVRVANRPGFLVNRLLGFYMAEALWLLHEGQRIEEIDRTMVAWGMPMGPVALIDEVGIDVAVKVAHILADAFPGRLPLPPWGDQLPAPDRLGAKTQKGLYKYDKGRRAEPDPHAYAVIPDGGRGGAADPSRLVDRMVLRMVDEAARCLAEGVIGSAAELDLAMVLGTGFPPFRGGLCRWADQQGVGRLVAELERLATAVGERFDPSPALREAASAGGFHKRWPAKTA
ncbi:MAG TPA: 3-hydroxyacyl-CoA dehydrogenase NAD-binding domain-containing protein [Thermoanaerobaculia bacterium]|jgi:3-hydroxyacyl-CoA dehydrogenase/enoyl-CoA hydratase/3-hydroxybutyryl-CoA epimerase|nr:3-hydroxyacyl-CoA dehydrogenase NAD-binding domain-containing protein [Thermoanaerobaculia bacterium]